MATVYMCLNYKLRTVGSVGRAATVFVATPFIMDSHDHITVGINFCGWKNFVIAKPQPRKLPAIPYAKLT